MTTNIEIDDKLLKEARRLGGHRTKAEAAAEALAEYIEQRKRLEIFKLFGTIDYDPSYDIKRERRAKRK